MTVYLIWYSRPTTNKRHLYGIYTLESRDYVIDTEKRLKQAGWDVDVQVTTVIDAPEED